MKARSTQGIANAFPGWSSIRVDEQSLGFQFLNEVGKRLDKLLKQEQNIRDNYFISTALTEDPDVFYSLSLGTDFVFTKESTDITNLPFTPPVVSGIKGGISYLVTATDKNNLESFWYSVPSSFTVEEEVDEEGWVAHGLVNEGIIDPLLSTEFTPNILTISLEGSTSCLGLQDNNQIRHGGVLLHGLNREGLEITEEVPLFYDGTSETIHEFKYIYPSGIRVYGVIPDTAELTISSANFSNIDYPISYAGIDQSKLDNDQPLFWVLGSGLISENATLDLRKYQTEEIELRLEGFTAKETLFQQELLDNSNNNIVPLDLAVDPHSDRIWVLTQDTLYIYSSEFPYPSFTSIKKKNYDSPSIID